MVKLKNILQEKKDLDNRHIDKLEKLTDRNYHTEARKYLAKLIGHKKLVEMYEHIDKLHIYFRDINDLKSARERLDKELFAQAKKMYSDYDIIHNAF